MKRVLAKFIKFSAAFALLCFVAFLALDFAYPLDVKALKRENSLILFDKDGRIVALRPSSDEIWRFEAKNIPQTLKDSVILFEDKFFLLPHRRKSFCYDPRGRTQPHAL